MTTVYRNAASVATERVLELTKQWESSIKSKDAGSDPDTNAKAAVQDLSEAQSSPFKTIDGRKYPWPESGQSDFSKDDK